MDESFANSSEDPLALDTDQQFEKHGCVYCGDFFSSSALSKHIIKCSVSAPWSASGTSEPKLVNPLKYILNEHDPGSSHVKQVPSEDVEEDDLTVLENSDYQNLLQEQNLGTTEIIDEQVELVPKSINQDNNGPKDNNVMLEIQSVVSIKNKSSSKDDAVIVTIYPEKNHVKTLTVLNNAVQNSASENKCDQSKIRKKNTRVPTKSSKTEPKSRNKKLVQIKPGQKLFQRIRSPVEEDTKEPGIFDFVDDDDDDKKKERQELKKLKERTCCHCYKIFDDEVAVLHHKREEHMPKKKIVSKLDLQPYILKPPQDHCPVCFKRVYNHKNNKALYVKHLMTHASVLESNLQCKVCERRFKRKDHLVNHERRHL